MITVTNISPNKHIKAAVSACDDLGHKIESIGLGHFDARSPKINLILNVVIKGNKAAINLTIDEHQDEFATYREVISALVQAPNAINKINNDSFGGES